MTFVHHSDKRSLEDLAIFGGTPLAEKPIVVGRPNIGNREALFQRLNGALDRKVLTNHGPLVQELEERLATFLGVKHCILVCNATIGLQLIAIASGMQGEVILPSFTFIATAHAFHVSGFTPVFCDIEKNSFCINPEEVERLINPRTRAIVGVHLFGNTCKTEQLEQIARAHGIPLYFDAAHAFACTRDGQFVGGFGDAEVFSFHATKFFNTLEGGAITTNNDSLAQSLRQTQNFGISGIDTVSGRGTNAKMSEFNAAMGLTSLDALDSFIEAGKNNDAAYRRYLKDVAGISIHAYPSGERRNYQYVIAEVDVSSVLNREALYQILRSENILVRRYFEPGCHRSQPYASAGPYTLPNTEAALGRVLAFPTGTSVTIEEIERICSLIAFVSEHSEPIMRRMENQ